MGHPLLNALDGKVICRKSAEESNSTYAWGCAGHPLIDGNRLICLFGGKAALPWRSDKDTGKELAACRRRAGYAPPMIFEAAANGS